MGYFWGHWALESIKSTPRLTAIYLAASPLASQTPLSPVIFTQHLLPSNPPLTFKFSSPPPPPLFPSAFPLPPFSPH